MWRLWTGQWVCDFTVCVVHSHHGLIVYPWIIRPTSKWFLFLFSFLISYQERSNFYPGIFISIISICILQQQSTVCVYDISEDMYIMYYRYLLKIVLLSVISPYIIVNFLFDLSHTQRYIIHWLIYRSYTSVLLLLLHHSPPCLSSPVNSELCRFLENFYFYLCHTCNALDFWEYIIIATKLQTIMENVY